MAGWTGQWKSSLGTKCSCECGKENSAERVSQWFDAEHGDSLKHDGETREIIRYYCEECIKKYGSIRVISK